MNNTTKSGLLGSVCVCVFEFVTLSIRFLLEHIEKFLNGVAAAVFPLSCAYTAIFTSFPKQMKNYALHLSLSLSFNFKK